MVRYTFTKYFEKEVLRKRSYLKKEWCIRVLENPLKSESKKESGTGTGAGLRSLRDG
jgi:hypothetical protein